jgi:hypothetical protein
MASTKKEEIKKHGDTLEPLIDRTGASTQRPRNDDATRHRRDEEQNPEGDSDPKRD